MKKKYVTAEVQVFLFEKPDAVVASGVMDITPVTIVGSDETEII